MTASVIKVKGYWKIPIGILLVLLIDKGEKCDLWAFQEMTIFTVKDCVT